MRPHLSPHPAHVLNPGLGYEHAITIYSLKLFTLSSSIYSTDRRLAGPSPGELSPALSATEHHY